MKVGQYADNFADLVQIVENIVQTHSFAQECFTKKDKVPSVVLFTKGQITDTKRFCPDTVLAFDKTFNLGKFYVTADVLKNVAVLVRETNEHPLFIGPVFIHGNSICRI